VEAFRRLSTHGLRRAVVGTVFTIAETVMAAALAFFRGGRLGRWA
jgi:hypothetical protein